MQNIQSSKKQTTENQRNTRIIQRHNPKSNTNRNLPIRNRILKKT